MSATAAHQPPQPMRTWTTPRLVARPASAEHANTLFEQYASDPAVARHMTWTPHRSVQETQEFLSRCEQVWSDGSAFPWTLWHRDDGGFVGLVEARVGSIAADLGYALARPWWGRGLMSEAVSAIIE